jgi:hypothetical protein
LGAEKNQSKANRSEREKTDSRFGKTRKWRKREGFALIVRANMGNNSFHFSWIVLACVITQLLLVLQKQLGVIAPRRALLAMRERPCATAQIQFAPPNYVEICLNFDS